MKLLRGLIANSFNIQYGNTFSMGSYLSCVDLREGFGLRITIQVPFEFIRAAIPSVHD